MAFKMDQLRKWHCSRTQILPYKAPQQHQQDIELPTELLTNSYIASLKDYLKLLKQKVTISTDIDQNILDNLNNEDELKPPC